MIVKDYRERNKKISFTEKKQKLAEYRRNYYIAYNT